MRGSASGKVTRQSSVGNRDIVERGRPVVAATYGSAEFFDHTTLQPLLLQVDQSAAITTSPTCGLMQTNSTGNLVDSIPGPARLQAFARRLNYLTILAPFRQEKKGGNRPVLPDGNAAGNAHAPDSVCGVTKGAFLRHREPHHQDRITTVSSVRTLYLEGTGISGPPKIGLSEKSGDVRHKHGKILFARIRAVVR
jgi:hypothetical protein